MDALPDWYQSDAPATSTPTEPPTQAAPTSVLPDWYSDGSQELRSTVKSAASIPPEQAAKVLRLKDQSGLPTSFVSRNVDSLEQQQSAQSIDPQEFKKRHPAVSQYMIDDPHHAALVMPDASLWGSVERTFNYMGQQSAKGFLDVEGSLRKMMKGFGYSSTHNDERIKTIDMENQYGLNEPAPGPISNVFGHAIEAMPAMGAAIGIGSAAAVASVPAGIGTAAAWGAMEFGSAYHDYVNRKDTAGNPSMDQNTARGFALLSGVGQGLLFALGGKILDEIPGMKMLQKEGLNTIIKSPTLLLAVKGIVSDAGKTALTMGGYSGFANLLHNAYGELAEMKGKGTLGGATLGQLISIIYSPKNLKAAVEAGVQGMQTGAVFGTAGGTLDVAADYRNYTQGMKAKEVYYINNYLQGLRTREGWNSIGKAIESSQMAKIAPGQVEKLVSSMVPESHVFVPLEQWQTYWAEQKQNPRAVFQEATGNPTAYDESMRTGADLQIPAGKYASTIAPSEHGEFFNGVVKSDPLAMSGEDADQSVKLRAKEEKEAEKAKSEKVIKDEIVKSPEDQAVQQSEGIQDMTPLFAEPAKLGMTEEKAARYKEAIEGARAKAQEDIVRDMTDKAMKKKSAAWLKERAGVQREVETEMNSQPGQIAITSLRSHITPDGISISRLSAEDIKTDFPEIHFSNEKFPEGTVIKSGGIHPDDAARRLGYDSGAELLYDLVTAPDKDAVVQQLTDERMVKLHPEIGGENVIDKAMEALHNDKRAQVLRLELEHLASDDFAAFKGLARSIGRRIPTIAEVRTDAERIIGNKGIIDTRPSLYQQGESLSSREAQEHFLRGDFDRAFEAKKAELLNHELYRAAINAKEQATKDVSFIRRYDSDSARARLGKAGADYLAQVDAIRDRFDFSKITDAGIADRQSLREWIQSQQEMGYNPAIPEDLLERSGKKSWREMTNDELHTTADAVRNIAHLAGLKNKLLAALDERTFDETRTKINKTLTDRFKITDERLNKPYDENPDFITQAKITTNALGAWLTRFEPLFKSVGLHDVFYDGINKAEDFKTKEMRKAADHFDEMMADYSKKDRSRFGRIFVTPELEGSGLSVGRSKISILMSLLHAGNEGNLKELLRGYRMSESQLQAMWRHLEPRDLMLAQNIWDFIGSYKEAIGDQERELNGLEPEWIKGRPFDVTLADGSVHHMEGGYFPLVYDRNVSWKTAALGQDQALKEMFGSYATHTATKHNWTQARVGGGGQAPSLKFNVFTDHISDVIHDLSYRKSVIDLHRIINDPDIQAHLQAGLGKGVYSQLNPWLKRIAGDRQWMPLGPLEMLRTTANNMTYAELGLKVGSAMVHMTSLLPATTEIGLGYMGRGFKAFQNPSESIKFMWNSSEFMKSRWEDVGDRDIRALGGRLNLINSQEGFWSELKSMSPIDRRDAFILMRCADLVVAGPTWYGAYFRAIDGKAKGTEAGNHKGAVNYADSIVRDTKGSGAAKDIAPIQTVGGPLGKLFTMFQTQLNVIANQMMNTVREAKVDRNLGKVAGATMMTWLIPAIAAQMLRGRFPSSDEGWVKWGLSSMAKFPLEMFPMTSPLVRYFEHPESKLGLLPVEEALGTMAKTAYNAATNNPITDKLTHHQTEWTAKDYQDAMMALGYARGIPTRQIMLSATRIHNWMSGEETHMNALTGSYSVFTGSKEHE